MLAATALVVAVAGLYLSLIGSTERLEALSSGADLEIAATTQAGIDEEVSFELLRLEEVEVAAPVIWHQTHVGTVPVLAMGVDARAQQISGVVGSTFAETAARFADTPEALLSGVFLAREAARLTGASEGDRLSFSEGPRLTVLGIVDGLDGVAGGRVVLGLRGVIQALAAKEGKVDSIFIRLADDAGSSSSVGRALSAHLPPGAILVPAGLRANQAASDLAPLRNQLAVVIVISAFAVALIIAITAGASARARSEHLRVMRWVGGPTRVLRLALIGEEMLIALPGALIGTVLGYAGGSALLDGLPGFIEGLVGTAPTFDVPPWLPMAGFAFGVGLAGISASTAARSFVSRQPLTEVHEEPSRSRPWLVVAGIGAMGAVAILTVALGGPVGVATLGLIGGFLVATRASAPAVGRLIGRGASMLGSSGRLAGTVIQRWPVRTWRLSSAVLVAVILVQLTTGLGSDAASAIDSIYGSYEEIDLLVQSTPADRTPSEPALPDISLEDLSGVSSTVPSRFTWVTVGRERVLFTGFGEGSRHPLLASARPEAVMAVNRGEGAVVTASFAARRGLEVGGSFEMIGKDGPAELTVLDIVDVVLGSNKGAVALSLEALSELTGDSLPTRYEISLDAGVAPDEVSSQIEETATGSVHAFPGSEQADAGRGAAQSVVRVFDGIALVVVLALVVTSFGAAAASAAERRREVAVLRALGAGRRRLLEAGIIEGAITAGGGAIVGAFLGSIIHRLISARSVALFGFEMPQHAPDLRVVLLALAAGLLPVIVGTLIPVLEASLRPQLAELASE